MKVSKAIREKADALKFENERLKKQMAEYDDMRELLSQLGLEANSSKWAFEDRIKEREALFPKHHVWAMRDLHRALGNALRQLEPKEENVVRSSSQSTMYAIGIEIDEQECEKAAKRIEGEARQQTLVSAATQQRFGEQFGTGIMTNDIGPLP
jgi:hypothetical protein